MQQKRSFIKAVLSDSCLIFVGILGSILCVTSSYRLTLPFDLLGLIIIISSLVSTIIYHLKKRARIISIISAYTALAVFLLLRLKIIAAGGVVFINTILTLLRRIYGGLPLLDMPDVTSTLTKDEYLLFFFGFVVVLVALLLAWALIRLKSPFICLIISLPFFVASVVFVNWTPSFSSVLLYLGFLLTTFLTNNIRLGKTNTGSGFILAIPVFAFLILLNFFNPPENYQRSDIGKRIYNYVASYFKLEAQTTKPPDVSDMPSTSRPSGTAPKTDPNLLSMRNARPPRGTDTVFNVRFPYEGIQYLRGASYTDYNNSTWILSKDSKFDYDYLKNFRSIDEMQIDFIITGQRHTFGFDIYNFPTFMALYQKIDYNYYSVNDSYRISYVMHSASFDIRDNKKTLTFAYMPYYSFNNSFSKGRFAFTDEYIAMLPTTLALEYYSYRVFAPDHIGNIDSFWNNNLKTDDVTNSLFNSLYTVNKDHLTKVPSDLKVYLFDLLKNEGLLSEANEIERTKKIVDFVKKRGKYSLNAPTTPQNKDFIRYFLETTNEGFCVHFASAATMLLRTAGIPARYVTGYVAPLDGGGEWFSVLENQAHAWTEVFVEGVGWVPIDATPGIPGLTVVNDTSNPNDVSSDTSSQPSTSDITSNQSTAPVQSTIHQESSENSVHGGIVSLKDWMNIIIFTVPIIIVLFFIIRRRIILNRRYNLIYGANTNKAVITAWQYIEKLMSYGISPPDTVRELALMAAFSNHNLSKEQANTVVEYATNSAKQIYKALPLFKKLLFMYFRCFL